MPIINRELIQTFLPWPFINFVPRTCVPEHRRLRAMEIWAFLLHFFGIKQKKNKPTQNGNVIPLFQSTLIAQRKFADATEHIYVEGKERCSISRYSWNNSALG